MQGLGTTAQHIHSQRLDVVAINAKSKPSPLGLHKHGCYMLNTLRGWMPYPSTSAVPVMPVTGGAVRAWPGRGRSGLDRRLDGQLAGWDGADMQCHR